MTQTIQQQRITLTNLKVAGFASEETLCFTATVRFDGKPIADASNDGHGGCTFLRPHKGARERLAEAEVFAKSLPPLLTDYDDPKDSSRKLTINITLDFLVDQIAADMHDDRKIRAAFTRDLASKVLFIKRDRLLFLRGVNLKAVQNKEAFFASLRGKHGADIVILNELPRETAFTLWTEYVIRKCGTGQEPIKE